MCDTPRRSCFLPMVCFLIPGVKWLALNLLRILSLFMLNMATFPSSWKCGTHVNTFSMSKHLEKRSLFKPVFNTVTRWLALQGRCSQSALMAKLGMGASEKGYIIPLAVGAHPCSECNERFVRQRVVEALTRGYFSHSWFFLCTSYKFYSLSLYCRSLSSKACNFVLLESGCVQDCSLSPAGWKRKLISDCADVHTALINGLKWWFVANNRSS